MQNSNIGPKKYWRPLMGLMLLMCLLLVGCSVIRMGYNHGESLSYWWLDNYINFNSQQKPVVQQQISHFFAWHRKTQLQDYNQLLGHAQKRLQSPVTTEQMLGDYQELKKRALILVEKELPDLTDLALSLTPQQISHIEQKFAKNNEDYRKDFLRGNVEQRQRFRFKKVMQQAEYWFGSFSREQEQLIRQASDARPLNNEVWMEERVRRQQAIMMLLRKIQAEHPSKEWVTQQLRGIIQAMFDPVHQAEQQVFFDQAREGSASLAALIVNHATAEQKRNANKRLQQWIDTFSMEKR